MSKYTLLLYSKNKKTIAHLLNFLKKKNQSFQILSKQSKVTRFSILKSPHINKKAQEQFQYIYFCTNISFFTNKIKKKLFIIKKIKNQLFPDLKILITGTYSKNKTIQKLLYPSNINPYNQNFFKINQKNFVKSTQKNLLKTLIFHFKTLDYYGKA